MILQRLLQKGDGRSRSWQPGDSPFWEGVRFGCGSPGETEAALDTPRGSFGEAPVRLADCPRNELIRLSHVSYGRLGKANCLHFLARFLESRFFTILRISSVDSPSNSLNLPDSISSTPTWRRRRSSSSAFHRGLSVTYSLAKANEDRATGPFGRTHAGPGEGQIARPELSSYGISPAPL